MAEYTISGYKNLYLLKNQFQLLLNNDKIRLAIVIIVTAIIISAMYRLHDKDYKYIKLMKSHKFMKASYYLDNWVVESGYSNSKKTLGFKYINKSGCYVIRTFKYPVLFKHKLMVNPKHILINRGDVYVGQSLNVTARVHSHLIGKGSGDIYHDLKSNRHVYVCFYPCTKGSLNKKEVKLIKKYNATESYNRTVGGGKSW